MKGDRTVLCLCVAILSLIRDREEVDVCVVERGAREHHAVRMEDGG